jgi:hypothetical protein
MTGRFFVSPPFEVAENHGHSKPFRQPVYLLVQKLSQLVTRFETIFLLCDGGRSLMPAPSRRLSACGRSRAEGDLMEPGAK